MRIDKEGRIHDDVENDWLARELREEDYHGCMSHKGAHPNSREGTGWAAFAARQEGYEGCEPHESSHYTRSRSNRHLERMDRSGGSPLGRLIMVLFMAVVCINLLLPLLMYIVRI